jgi:large subunit ribosomal protein L24
MAAKIKKGDLVEVITGKDKGKRGRVLEILPDENRVVVEGVNVQKRHIKAGARQSMPQGGILDKPGKIHLSNVRFFSDKLDAGVRVGFTVKEDGTKVRVARGASNGTELD